MRAPLSLLFLRLNKPSSLRPSSQRCFQDPSRALLAFSGCSFLEWGVVNRAQFSSILPLEWRAQVSKPPLQFPAEKWDQVPLNITGAQHSIWALGSLVGSPGWGRSVGKPGRLGLKRATGWRRTQCLARSLQQFNQLSLKELRFACMAEASSILKCQQCPLKSSLKAVAWLPMSACPAGVVPQEQLAAILALSQQVFGPKFC